MTTPFCPAKCLLQNTVGQFLTLETDDFRLSLNTEPALFLIRLRFLLYFSALLLTGKNSYKLVEMYESYQLLMDLKFKMTYLIFHRFEALIFVVKVE